MLLTHEDCLESHLMVVEGRDDKPGVLAWRDLVLPVKEPALCHDLCKVRPPQKQLIVSCDGRGPAAEATAPRLLEAEQTCEIHRQCCQGA